MIPNNPTSRVRNVRLSRQIERLHRLFFPAETFRANPRTTNQKAKILHQKKWIAFVENRLQLTAKTHTDYWFKNGIKKSWNTLSVIQRERMVRKLLQHLIPKGEIRAEELATRLTLLSAFMQLKTTKLENRQATAQTGSTQFMETPVKAIQYANLSEFYLKTAAGLRAGMINPTTGAFLES